jgi:predicted tellurium resistance membrane protein TerC
MIEAADLVTVALLVALEGLLSADNAMVLAVLVLSLPKSQQKQALRYGILGAFLFRGLATLLAVYLIELAWVKIVGAGYLLSPKLWVILTGGILGIIAMRLVIGRLLALIEHYPALVDGAFVIIGWVGIKLLVEFLHTEGYIGFEIPKWLSLGLIVVIFTVAFLYARQHEQDQRHKDHTATDDAAKQLLEKEGESL